MSKKIKAAFLVGAFFGSFLTVGINAWQYRNMVVHWKQECTSREVAEWVIDAKTGKKSWQWLVEKQERGEK